MFTPFDQFVSLEQGSIPYSKEWSTVNEKHLFVLGCLSNHRAILIENRNYVGGNWSTEISSLENLEKDLYRALNLQVGSLTTDFERFLVRDLQSSNNGLSRVFPRACRIMDDRNR